MLIFPGRHSEHSLAPEDFVHLKISSQRLSPDKGSSLCLTCLLCPPIWHIVRCKSVSTFDHTVIRFITRYTHLNTQKLHETNTCPFYMCCSLIISIPFGGEKCFHSGEALYFHGSGTWRLKETMRSVQHKKWISVERTFTLQLEKGYCSLHPQVLLTPGGNKNGQMIFIKPILRM